jgi:hypothetical protein
MQTRIEAATLKARTRISCHAELERTACAPFHEERRVKLAGATKFHRKPGGGPAAKRQPSPEGLGILLEDDPSAGGTALNLTSCIISRVAHTLSKQENHAQIKDP